MVLVSEINRLREAGRDIDEAIASASRDRLRPILMASLVALFGFIPMAVSHSSGAEVQRPLATVVIGGVISAMIMSLLVIRVLYVVVDWVAGSLQWLLAKALRVRPESLSWLFGEHPGAQAPAEGDGAKGRAAREPVGAST